jgi:molecular chaperone GrpE (heat shock protein)
MFAGSAVGLDEKAAAELTEAEAKLKAAEAEADEAEADRMRAEADLIRAEGDREKAEAEAEAIRKSTDELVADSQLIRKLLIWQSAKSDSLTVALVALLAANLAIWGALGYLVVKERARESGAQECESSLLR